MTMIKMMKNRYFQQSFCQGLVQHSARMDHLVKYLEYLCNRNKRKTERSKSAVVTNAIIYFLYICISNQRESGSTIVTLTKFWR